MPDPTRVRVVCPMETHGWPDNVPAMRRCPACGGDSYAGHYAILATPTPETAVLMEMGEAAFAWLMIRGDEGKPFWTGPEIQRVFAAVEAMRSPIPTSEATNG